MHVHNDQDCTLVIGDVRIKSGETKPVPESWAPRVQALVDIGALRGHGAAPKADDRPSRAMSPREIWLAMSEADRAAILAEQQNVMAMAPKITVTGQYITEVSASEAPLPAEVADAAVQTVKAEFKRVAESMGAEPSGAPVDFATCHVNKAKAWVNKCSDADLLTRLGNDENRETVLAAIIDRIAALKPSN
jgi:hypothetical protein